MPKSFNTQKYVQAQSEEILKRLKTSENRFYLEIGGKLCTDFHASRVLPGYEPDTKLQVLEKISENLELVYCISAPDLERERLYSDTGMVYNKQVFEDLKNIEERGLKVSSVAITIYNKEEKADILKKQLDEQGIPNNIFNRIANYPKDIDHILSDQGFGKEPKPNFKERLVAITGPGGGSGKMGICMIQLYHDYKAKNFSKYAKYETFPIWNLPLTHPVNLAYEAATADLGDYNMIDPYYKKKTGEESVNYNRDVENFEILKELLTRLDPEESAWVTSPTEMGINMDSEGFVDEEKIKNAAETEILARYKEYQSEFQKGVESEQTVKRAEEIMKKAGLAS
jgi:uncharacterized protein (UPF0371 family)|tara:strand:+ start:3136 stop:4158 length:1023 start_codon:yes stop_codon:yes gene_type:complete